MSPVPKRLQPSVTRLSDSQHGIQYLSPLRPRGTRKKNAVVLVGQSIRKASLLKRIQGFHQRAGGSSNTGAPIDHGHPVDDDEVPVGPDDMEVPSSQPPVLIVPGNAVPLLTSKSKAQLCLRWNELLPKLVEPFAQYTQAMYGKAPTFAPDFVNYECQGSCTEPITVVVQCLYISHTQHIRIKTCKCKPVGVLMVEHGLFPASPSKPRNGVSIDFLDVYRALFERSCDAITALAAALNTIYRRRGFDMMSDTNPEQRAADPFRSVLTNAVQWYSNLRAHLQKRLDTILVVAEAATLSPTPSNPLVEAPSLAPRPLVEAPSLASHPPTAAQPIAPAPPEPTQTDVPSTPPGLTSGQADRILRDRCPLCFGLDKWGRPLAEGGDVQLGGDGCFSYKHLRTAGDGPIGYDPSYFVPREAVRAVRERILKARKATPANVRPAMPAEALLACEESWNAANEKKQRADPKRYDASGVFVCTCRHSQILFFCDIDTPGEQQQFIIALMEEVARHCPPEATFVQAYDVACQTDHSCNLFPILDRGLRPRVGFMINAMHAFGHQWVCQLVYSPRMRVGAGLSDMEGVERVWSRIRRLIPLTRQQWNSRRIWALDQYAAFVNDEGFENLGHWLVRQATKNLPTKQIAAAKTLWECGVSVADLRREWEYQREAQTSHRAHAPARLKRDLDKVFALQVQIDAVEKAINDCRTSISSGDVSIETANTLQSLQTSHAQLSRQAEALYASLNIDGAFPELRDLPLPFVRALLTMRNLKRTIREKAVGAFFELETLNQAVAGRGEALGTKLATNTSQAMQRRHPALMRLVRKFNELAAVLEAQRPEDCRVPIPLPLPTRIRDLQNDPSLQQDVWISASTQSTPRWLADADVRDGIRSLHVLDRCREETSRLEVERVNMRRWLSRELIIVRKAISIAAVTDASLPLLLLQRQKDLQQLETTWAPALALNLAIRPHLNSQLATAVASAGPVAASPVRPTHSLPPARVQTSHRDPAAVQAVEDEDDDFSVRPPVTVQTSHRDPTVVEAVEDEDDDLIEELEPHAAGQQSLTLDELDPGMTSDPEEPLSVHDTLDILDDVEETCDVGLDDARQLFTFEWDIPELITDSLTVTELHERNRSLTVYSENWTRAVTRTGRRALTITPEDLARLESPNGRLNNFILNGLAASIHTFLAAEHCALLSTHDLPRARYRASDDNLWHALQPTRYWDKPIWLIPIHRPNEEHWVLAVVAVHQRQLGFFDSLGSRRGWRSDLADIMTLITRMIVLANRKGHGLYVTTEEGGWTARPFYCTPCQTNDYDCGVWVLLVMAAVMRGCHTTGVTEVDIGQARRILAEHVRTLPPA